MLPCVAPELWGNGSKNIEPFTPRQVVFDYDGKYIYLDSTLRYPQNRGMYLQITQAAKLLNVSRQSVHTWINRGQIGTTLIAGRRLVLQDERFKALQQKHRDGK